GRPVLQYADYDAALLSAVGIEGTIHVFEPGRSNYVARIAGDGREPGALLVHGHLDVVPADPTAWRHPPFAAEIVDGCIWGRGAVDMKNMVAMILAALRRMAADGTRPRRDLIVCFFADEEGGFRRGSRF